MIKFEHSVFALPFAYLGLFLASNGLPELHIFIWVTVAMVALRTSAMCFNRLLDHAIDAENPRTQNRALPRQLITRRFTWVMAVVGVFIFIKAAENLNPLCLTLAPVPIALSLIYPLVKRVSWLSHWVLGLTLGIAPYGGWLAAQPEWNWIPGLLTIAVLSWVSGFDIFYALQDADFDRQKGLFSLPASFGDKRAIFVAKCLQGLTILALILVGVLASRHLFYWIGLILVAGFIYREHRLIDKFGLSKINEAFFNMNAWVSVVIFLATFLDLMI